MSDFNAKEARKKRPCPLWVDAFQRDTQHLGADEVGVYMLLLMAMWTRESCDLPDDAGRLAKVGRISKRLWDSRIGPAIMPFFKVENGAIISKRLRIEAAFVEKHCRLQSERSTGSDAECDPLAKPTGSNERPEKYSKNDDKSLIKNDTAPTTDKTTDNPGRYPTQQPNNLLKIQKEEEGAQARVSLSIFEEVMLAVGVDPAKPPKFWRGSAANTHVLGWQLVHQLTDDEVVEVARLSRQDNPEPPDGPKALDRHMAAFAKAKASAGGIKPTSAAKAGPLRQPVDQAAVMAFWANEINKGAFVAPSAIRPDVARAMLAAKLVTPEQLREKGIAA